MPVGVVAGQPGAFQAEHDPGPAQRHLGDHLLEAFPVRGRCAGLALVDVDHGDLAGVPAQRDRLAAQVVLADRGLGVVDDLLEAGLPDVEQARRDRWAAVTFDAAVSGSIGSSFGWSSGYGGGPGMVPASATAARTLMSSAARPGRLVAGPAGPAGRAGRCAGGRGEAGQGMPPGGDALAGQHAEAERERLAARVQGGMAKVLVAGVQHAAGGTVLAGIQAGAWFSSRVAR